MPRTLPDETSYDLALAPLDVLLRYLAEHISVIPLPEGTSPDQLRARLYGTAANLR